VTSSLSVPSAFARLSSLFLIQIAFCLAANAQVNVLTYHNDAARTGQNTSETVLTTANVAKATFGLRFIQPVDGYVVAQPLYLSNVNIVGLGVHNVVYVVTLNDSVYAFDSDSNTGANASPLWKVNFTNPAAGITTATGTNLPCEGTTGYSQAGIISTPVIDLTTQTMYLVAKTDENGTVVHRLHALDVTSGAEKFGGPVVISGTFKANNGVIATFKSLHAMNRPALLENNGYIYIGFGSNGCNDSNYGWVFAYQASNLQRTAIFNTSPNHHYASVWQSGAGLTADSNGDIYFSTGEGTFTANTGGQDFASSFVKLNGLNLSLADYFTPYNEQFISAHDLDLSSSGVVVLPDQPGPNPHLLIGCGKMGTVYVLNRDNMGKFNASGDTQIVQEMPSAVGTFFGVPAYWNNNVYMSGNYHPIMVFALSNGTLASPPFAQSVKMPGEHPPTISSNGTTNGVLWEISGKDLFAFNALTLATLYNSSQAGTRDALPPVAHFVTQTVANGKVYIGTQNSLAVYGLF